MKLPKFNNCEKYLVAVSLMYLMLAYTNLVWEYMTASVSGVLFILMLALPFIVPQVGKIIFKK